MLPQLAGPPSSANLVVSLVSSLNGFGGRHQSMVPQGVGRDVQESQTARQGDDMLGLCVKKEFIHCVVVERWSSTHFIPGLQNLETRLGPATQRQTAQQE